jgi:AcrR family transcriptional regulator
MVRVMAAVQPVNRHQGSRAQTRRRLLDVGRRAFARHGHAGVNLKEDILVPAGVSVGSFYHQFRDKTALFLAILSEHSETFRAMLRDAQTLDGAAAPGDVARHRRVSAHNAAHAGKEGSDLRHAIRHLL